MMLSDLSSDHEATGSSSHGGDIATSYALSPPPLFLAPAAEPTAPPLHQQPELEQQHRAAPGGAKRKRSQPGNPDPGAEVVALSPRALVATNRFVCEICNKGFQRDQNLQLHRRGHNLPWKLRQRGTSGGGGGRQGQGGEAAPPRKRVYVCPEPTCVHHDPARALGDLTGIKKHFSRKHGEKRWRCERCGKRYAVQSDWKAHVKGCGAREYRCDCGILFSRKDSLLTHRAFCDALAEESARLLAAANNGSSITHSNGNSNDNLLMITNTSGGIAPSLFLPFSNPAPAPPPAPAAHHQNPTSALFFLHQDQAPLCLQPVQPSPHLLGLHGDAAAAVGIDAVSFGGGVFVTPPDHRSVEALRAGGAHRRLTRDFLGVYDDDGEVEELQLPPMCASGATTAASTTTTGPRAASCATDLTRQYLGERVPPPVNEAWSHNYF